MTEVTQIDLGQVVGATGATGATGPTGPQGPGATITVGTVTTTTYGNPAQVTNSGTETDAVLDFIIPQGAPGEEVTDVSSLTLDSVTSTAASFPIPAVGEVMSVIMGKIIKFFGDTVAALNSKLNRSDVTTSLGVTTTGKALDATAGKTLNDAISTLNDSFPGLSGINRGLLNNIVRADNVDINNYLTQGIYYLGSNITHGPDASGFYFLVVFRTPNGNDGLQIACAVVDQNIYRRRISQGTIEGQQWTRLTFTTY